MSHNIEKRLIELKQAVLTDSRIIIAHESGNAVNTGKNALENEVAYMKSQALKGGAFVSHWVGGGGRIIQLSKSGFVQYGAGAKGNRYAYAQIELARTLDPLVFKKDYLAYVWLLKTLAQEARIPRTLNTGNTIKEKGIKTHHWVSDHLGGTNHRDPDGYLASFGISLTQFATDLADSSKENTLKKEPEKTHLVKYGDTLWSIAKKHHLTVTWLKKLNRLPSDQINIGTVLLLTGNQTDSPQSTPSLKKESVKNPTEIMKHIQRHCGTISDGYFGPITKKALLCLFQEAIHTKIDGFWGPKTAFSARNIQLNSKGEDVYALQAMLVGLGYDLIGTPDGIAGPLTRQAILAFQKDQGLTCDGIAGKKTLSLVFR